MIFTDNLKLIWEQRTAPPVSTDTLSILAAGLRDTGACGLYGTGGVAAAVFGGPAECTWHSTVTPPI